MDQCRSQFDGRRIEDFCDDCHHVLFAHGEDRVCSVCEAVQRMGPPADTRKLIDIGYSAARAFDAEGARCGIVTCKRCAAAILIDPADDFDAMARHATWHVVMDRS